MNPLRWWQVVIIVVVMVVLTAGVMAVGLAIRGQGWGDIG